ncbi:hypothetical protein Bca4012_055794 [Brassica carinata]|uniref:Uncharacterized protein n=1 Tax=Brassica carinata TaxID=52824 RepID=A0A8X7W321_BRACI|nr:hypothetical protein Bca52824_014483 [Brassica carinata]
MNQWFLTERESYQHEDGDAKRRRRSSQWSQHIGVKVVTPETEQGVDKQSSETLSTFSPGGGKSSRDHVSKPHVAALAMKSSCFEFGFAQPTVLFSCSTGTCSKT